ncbi:germination protein YpeB [Thalassobacillus sp. C254]|uniref:germination protein YpeB n=1 Tax=Thalassobacillus sp. C254 TaxID=1225341 RepID=UPI0006CF66A8|nr:germination protein YpeB [Thalassobacillus sp. C254]
MIRNIIIGALAIGVIGLGFWGFNENQEKSQVLMQTENNYQRAFHDLAYHIDQLEDEIGSTLAMNSRKHLSGSLAEVWRVTSLAQSEMGQLPLGMIPVSKTEEFLYNIGDFSYETSIRNLDDDPLSDEEYEELQNYYEQAKEIKHDLRQIQASALREGWHWTDAESELLAQQEPMNNSIVNGFTLIDEKVEGFSETNWGPENGFGGDFEKRLSERIDDKEEIDEEKAVARAKEFLDVPNEDNIVVQELGEGSFYEGYELVIEDPERESSVYMEMTKKGGLPLFLLESRNVGEPQISLNAASERAEHFLERNHFDSMQLIDSSQYESVGVFQFAPVQDNVRLYPDIVTVDVALDTGDVIGYEGVDYFANHKERQDLSPELDEEEAEEALNPNLEVREAHAAVIENEEEEEVLCYEFYGTLGQDTFRIFINAKTGEEEQIDKMAEAEPVYNTDY